MRYVLVSVKSPVVDLVTECEKIHDFDSLL